jgi:hypothetical protein
MIERGTQRFHLLFTDFSIQRGISARDSQFLHPGMERGSLHPVEFGCTVLTAHPTPPFFKRILEAVALVSHQGPKVDKTRELSVDGPDACF